jgi:hypothetical protein
VAIRASSAQQIEILVADLASPSGVTREAAIARLTVIGPRAVGRLIAVAKSGATRDARLGAWRALDAIADDRALAPALALLGAAGADPLEGVAAVGVAERFLRGQHSAAAVDRLTAVAVDGTRTEEVRLAALGALQTLDGATIAPLLASLAGDGAASVRRAAGRERAQTTKEDPLAVVISAAEGGWRDEPAAVRRALVEAGKAVPLPVLLRLVEQAREHEATDRHGRRDQWTMTRAAAHVALAARGSRLALYDLRESLDRRATPLPVEFLAALSMVGDAACLEPIAAAYAVASEGWWRDHLAEAFREIVRRERLTSRSAAIKKIERRSPETLRALWPRRASRPFQ